MKTGKFIPAAIFAVIILLSGGFPGALSAMTVPEVMAAQDTLTETQKGLMETAMEKIGCRYSRAGQGPERFDCSGLMLYVFGKYGITLPHGSAAQYHKGKALENDEPLRPCDLVFFSGSRISSSVGHVGMVLDYDPEKHEFTFIHAAMTGVEIQKSTADYYVRRYIGARRILE